MRVQTSIRPSWARVVPRTVSHGACLEDRVGAPSADRPIVSLPEKGSAENQSTGATNARYRFRRTRDAIPKGKSRRISPMLPRTSRMRKAVADLRSRAWDA